jgi:hypothetical protein
MTPSEDTISSIKDLSLMFGEILGVFVVGLGIGAWGIVKKQKLNWSSRWKDVYEKKFVETHTQIHELLTELRLTSRSCRCLIFQFHNGGAFADGSSIKRFSVTHESCAAGVGTVILDSQDVLLTRYAELVRVLDDKPSKILSIRDVPSSAFRSGLEINSVDYFTVIPLKCSDGISPLGFVCCHWCTTDSLDEIEQEGITQNTLEQVITEAVENINAHLNYKKKK